MNTITDKHKAVIKAINSIVNPPSSSSIGVLVVVGVVAMIAEEFLNTS